MPDITMCGNYECKLAPKCYRSSLSGTQGSDYQSYCIFNKEQLPECEHFWEIKK